MKKENEKDKGQDLMDEKIRKNINKKKKAKT